MPIMANTAMRFKDKKLAMKINGDYIDNYLILQPKRFILRNENITFLKNYTGSSHQKAFAFLFKNKDLINKSMNDFEHLFSRNYIS